jgi:hypothetical protein
MKTDLELFNAAWKIYLEMGGISTAILMRKLGIDFMTADELKDKVLIHAKYHENKR